MADLSMRTSARETDATGASSRPITPMSPADRAAHAAASYVRPTAVLSALRLETDLAYLLKDRQVADAARREIAEYAGVAA